MNSAIPKFILRQNLWRGLPPCLRPKPKRDIYTEALNEKHRIWYHANAEKQHQSKRFRRLIKTVIKLVRTRRLKCRNRKRTISHLKNL